MHRSPRFAALLCAVTACGGAATDPPSLARDRPLPPIVTDEPSADGATDGRDAGPTSDDTSPIEPTDAPSEVRDTADVPVALPGSIDGVEPEAQSHHPPMIDPKGSIYRVTESVKADGNRPRMMVSRDHGAHWAEVDRAGRPPAVDLEGCHQLQSGDSIFLSVANSKRVWFSEFRTSGASEGADRWRPTEVVVADLGDQSGVKQFSSLARTADGQFWLFHSDRLVSERQQIAFRRRATNGVWGPGRRLDEEAGSWTAPRAIAARADLTWVFYKDHATGRLLARTLDAAGALSTSRRVDLDGTGAEASPHTNPVSYTNGDREVVVIVYADRAGLLRSVTIENGTATTVQLVASTPALANPKVALNEGVVAHLAVHGTTVHALWVDRDSGDIVHASRSDRGAWSRPVVAWASGGSTAWWVYANAYRRAGRARLAFTYDVGPHADDVGRIEYDELALE
jgi:hypothetical protein